MAAAAALIVAGCAGGEATAEAPSPGGARGGGPPAVPVATATVVQKSMPIEIRAIGSAEPYSTVDIRSQTTGQLIAVNFREGEEVTRGQVLFELDRRPLEAALQQAQANLERDLAQSANAELQAKRFLDLVNRGIAAREQADNSRAAAEALRATVDADRAAVENAKVQLQYATITAPISGRTGALRVHEGNLVRANDATPLVTIHQVAPISVGFALPESRLPELKRHMAAGALSMSATAPRDDAVSVGRITFVDNAVNPETGTILVKGTFPNGDRRLWPGQYVNIVVTLSNESGAVVVPSVAVQSGQQGTYVFAVKADRTVEMRPVDVARTRGEEAVIARGVSPGDVVVTDGHLRLVAGTRIDARESDTAQVPQ
jgi:multidrug efflux system membrane fusion protein